MHNWAHWGCCSANRVDLVFSSLSVDGSTGCETHTVANDYDRG